MAKREGGVEAKLEKRIDKNARFRQASDGELLGPLLCGCFVFGPVRLVDVCYFRHERVVWVCVCQKRADGEQHLGDGQRWRPLFL